MKQKQEIQKQPLVKLHTEEEFEKALKDLEKKSIDPKLVKKKKNI